MDHIRFTDSHCSGALMPFTLTRHTADIRLGMFTIREKWKMAQTIHPTLNIPVEIPADIIPGPAFFSKLSTSDWANTLRQKDLYKVLEFPWQISMYNDWALRQDFSLTTSGKKSAILSPTVHTTNSKDIFFEQGW